MVDLTLTRAAQYDDQLGNVNAEPYVGSFTVKREPPDLLRTENRERL